MNSHFFTGMRVLDPMHGVCHGPLLLAMGASTGAASTIGTVAMAAGTILGSAGAIQQGNAASATANYTAAQLDASAKTERATSQREAINQRMQKDVVMSRARAVGAASGGGLDLDLMGDIEEEGEYRALTALWEGEERAKGRNAQAAGVRASGQFKKRAGGVRAFSTGLTGFSTILSNADPTFLEKHG